MQLQTSQNSEVQERKTSLRMSSLNFAFSKDLDLDYTGDYTGDVHYKKTTLQTFKPYNFLIHHGECPPGYL